MKTESEGVRERRFVRSISGRIRSRTSAGAIRLGLVTALAVAWQLPVSAGTPLVAWGKNWNSQTNVPAAATNLMAVCAGWQHGLALRGDGSLVPWGDTNYSLAVIPAGASNIVSIAAGDYHSLALRADGQLFAWGKNEGGESTVPANATNIVAIDGGYTHTVALRADGSVTAWGDNTLDQLNIPASATDGVAVAASLDASAVLKADGTVVAWGFNQDGETNVPPSATNVVAIAAGATHFLALRADGTAVAWGSKVFGETTVPTNVFDVATISAGQLFNLVLLQDGSATGWGYDYNHQATPPPEVTNPAALYAGGEFSIAWLRGAPDGVAPRVWKEPAGGTVAGGRTLLLLPGISGTPPLRCQWYFNDASMPGQTNRWLGLLNANPTESGNYQLIVTNDYGAATSAVATVSVPAIRITTQPAGTNVLMHDGVTLSASVAGVAPLSFRWQKDGQDLNDTNRIAGSATLNLTIATVEPGDTGNYRLIVTNAYDAVTSDVAVVTVRYPQPLLNVDFGSSVQSSKTGYAVVGQTPSDFWNGYAAGTPGITNVLFADGSPTRVSVVVSNAPSWFWNYSVDPMMHEAVIPVGGPTPFPVAIFGLPPGTYSFYLYSPGNTYLAVGSDFELLVGGVSLGHRNMMWGPDAPPWQEGGNYGVFTNITVNAPGQAVTIIVRGNYYFSPAIAGLQIGQFLSPATAPVLWSQPASQYVPISLNLVLNATGSGYPAPVHQWFFNDTPLTNGGRYSGADRNTLTIAAADFTDTGDYHAVLTNAAGVVTSDVAHVVVGVPPGLPLAPSNQTWISGTSVALEAQATGTDPLSYQWYLGATPLTNSAHLSGTTSNLLSVSHVVPADAGTYTLVVTNLFGSVTATAAVAVVVPPSFTIQPAGHSAPVGLPMTLQATVTGTAPVSYQWQFFGTNVPGATSNALNIAALAPTDFGDYRLLVSNYGGSATSDVAQVTVGPVATWGNYGQRTLLPLWPGPGLSNVVATAGGYGYSMALRGDGTACLWGDTGLSNYASSLSGIVGIAAGFRHALAIRSNGTVVAWGLNTYGQTNVPAGLSNVVAVAAGNNHSAALRSDGTVVVWGGTASQGQTNISPGLMNVVVLDACGYQTLALRENGTVVGWGGQTPTPTPPYLHGVVGLASGGLPSDLNLALLTNGTVEAWSGYPPATNTPADLTNILAVDLAGVANDQGINRTTGVGMALRSDGTVTAWGSTIGNITNVPTGLSNVVAIAGAPTHALALVNDGRPLIVRPPIGGTFSSGERLVLRPKILGDAPRTCQWYKDGIPLPGATGQRLVLSPLKSTDAGDYHLVVSNTLGIAQSVAVPITVVDSPPVLMSQPASRFAYYGSPFSVAASVAGSEPLQLTWLQNSQPIAYGTSELAFDRALPQHEGDYRLIASNAFGSVTSAVAHLTFSRVAFWGTAPSLTTASCDLGTILGVAAGYTHALAIQSNRTVAAWGTTSNGTTNVPPGLGNVVAVAAGNGFSVALQSDGTVEAWGLGNNGQTNVLAGLSNVVAISVGQNHTLALRADGTVASWGYNTYGQVPVPAGLSNVVAVAAGSSHSLALRSDGTVVPWGLYGTMPNYTNAVAIAAGFHQSAIVQVDGTVVTWSTSSEVLTLPPGLSNVVAVSLGGDGGKQYHGVALRTDGTLAAWGNNTLGQLAIPPDLRSATALSAGGSSTLAFLGDGSPAVTVQPWSRLSPSGTNLTLRAWVTGAIPLACQWYRNGVEVPGATGNSLLLGNTEPSQGGAYQLVATNQYGAITSAVATVTITVPAVWLAPLGLDAAGFKFSFNSLSSVLYTVEYQDTLTSNSWTELEQRVGKDATETVTDPAPSTSERYYRVRAQYAP